MIRRPRSRLAEVRTRSEEPSDAPRVRTQSGTRYLVLAGLIMSGLLTLAITILAVVDRPQGRSTVIAALSALAGTVGWLAFIAVGGLVAWRRPSNPIAWLLLGDGLVWLTGLAIEGYVDADGRRAGAPTMGALLESFGWIAGLALVALILLLYPTGREPTSRWRAVRWVIVGSGLVTAVALLLNPGPMESFAQVENPFGVSAVSDVAPVVAGVGQTVFFGGIIASMVSVVVRYRRSAGLERQQIRWLAFAAVLMALGFAVSDLISAFGGSGELFNVLPFAAVPLAVGIAILRYHVWDLDIVAGGTMVYTALAVVITGIYAFFVAGLGALIGAGVTADIWLVVLATAVAAVVLQPVREAARAGVRRMLFPRARAQPTPAMEVAIRTLGGFRVERHGRPLGPSEWQSKKGRQLLKMLIANRGRPVHRDRLIDALWPDEVTGNLTNRLAVSVSTLRAVLDPDKTHPADHYIVGEDETLRVDLGRLTVDVEQFLELAAFVLANETADAETATSMYGGDFLEEDLYEDWAHPLREEARATYLALLRRQARNIDLSDVDGAVSVQLRILEFDPWDESAHLGLIDVLSRSGRHGEARRANRRYQARMEAVGVTPRPDLAPID